MLGQSYLEATSYKKIEGILMQCKLLCHIRGRMCQKDLIYKNDIVLVSLREFEHENAQTHIGDIINAYLRNERDLLKSWVEIPIECEDFVEFVSKPKIKRNKFIRNKFHKKINKINEKFKLNYPSNFKKSQTAEKNKKNNKTKPSQNKENSQNTKATNKNKTSQQPKQSKENKTPFHSKAPKLAKKPPSAN